MKSLRWWMRAMGALYVFMFLAAAVFRLPIRAEGPAGLLTQAEAHDATAVFVLDTWITFGLYIGAVGVALLRFSREPERAQVLVWTAIGMELAGIMADVNKLSHGYVVAPPLVWMVIHSAAIVTGYLCLRSSARKVDGVRRALT